MAEPASSAEPAPKRPRLAKAGPDIYTLGIDAGTQSVKALLWDVKAQRVLGRGSAPLSLSQCQVPCGTRAEQEPDQWLIAAGIAVTAALQALPADSSVSAVSVSGQQHGMVCVDASGKPVRPAKLWCDSESSEEARLLAAHPAFAGWALPPAMTVTKVAWLAKNEASNWSRTAKVLLPSQYVSAALFAGSEGIAAAAVAELSDASGFGVLDAAGGYDAARCAAADPVLFERLPPLLPSPESVAGKVSPEGIARLGLQGFPAKALLGAAVGPGGGDNAMAALGAGAVHDGSVVLSLGTSGTVFLSSSAAIPADISGDVAPFRDCCGGYLPLYCVQNCTEPLADVVRLVGAHRASLEELAASEAAGCGSLLFLPYLRGERSPNWPSARGAFIGLAPGALARSGLLFRAAMEGAALSLRRGLTKIAALSVSPGAASAAKPFGCSAPAAILVGGGSQSPLWRRILADALGKPVRGAPGGEVECAALGAALQAAAVATGAKVRDVASAVAAAAAAAEEPPVEPIQANVQVYEAAFRRFTLLGEALFGDQGAWGDEQSL